MCTVQHSLAEDALFGNSLCGTTNIISKLMMMVMVIVMVMTVIDMMMIMNLGHFA